MAVNNALIGALRAEATLESGKFVDGAKKLRTESSKTEAHVKKSFSGMSTAMGALKAGIAGFVGALSVGLITRGIQSSLQYASSLKDVSQQLGITTKDLQTLRFAAGQLGVSQQQLETGLQNLIRTLGQVAAGAERPRKALAAIGITAKDLAGLDAATAFRRIADGLKGVEDRSQRAAVEVALFGEAGSRLDTMLAGGSERINALSAAAEELGIVLSDEQIQKADETANKVEALKTVLSAQIAGVVADNADSILGLANAIAELVSQLPNAINQIRAFYHEVAAGFARFQSQSAQFVESAAMHPINRFNPLMAPLRAGSRNRQTVISGGRLDAREHDWQAFLARSGISGLGVSRNAPAPVGTGTIDPFLAPKGRTPRAKKPPRDRSDDVEFQFAEELRRAEMDILRAKRELARTADERYLVDLAILELERLDRDAEIANRVRRAERDFAEGKITEAALAQAKLQAELVEAKGDEAAMLKRQKLDRERAQQQFEDQVRLEQVGFELQQEALESQLQLADTASEERDIRLRLLDLSYRQERARLQAVIADEEATEAAKNEARARLEILGALQAADRVGILRSTQNPLEAWAATIPQTAAQINEALQSIQADSLENAADAAADLTKNLIGTGTAIDDLAADFARLLVKMLMFQALSAAFPGFFGSSGVTGEAAFGATAGLPGFASGGSFNILGNKGIDKNTLSLNGLPIANVSYGERLSVGNDNAAGVGGRVIVELHGDIDARIAEGANIQIIRAAPLIKADTMAAVRDHGRRGRR